MREDLLDVRREGKEVILPHLREFRVVRKSLSARKGRTTGTRTLQFLLI